MSYNRSKDRRPNKKNSVFKKKKPFKKLKQIKRAT